ncbi:MAG TPA: M28 family peptidase [Candidatus Acidoferrales bacterium]|nr:M28 family peptidase [Candidatus Acidoferrales bacterium]
MKTLTRMGITIGALAWIAGCNSGAAKASVEASGNDAGAKIAQASAKAADTQDKAPPASQTGGFDGQKAFDYTAKLVSFGPRPSGSDALRQMQAYVLGEMKTTSCEVEEDNFHAQTPIGVLTMKNIVVKAPGEGKGIILLLTHYDTVRVPNFVGADDGGSSSGLMMELARHVCGEKHRLGVWMAFVDGEEAQGNWADGASVNWTGTNETYGSRELAAKLDLEGRLKDVKAVLLVDMVGQKGLHLWREDNSTPWLADLVWDTADKLGYGDVFVKEKTGAISDDHLPFLAKHVPCVDIIDLTDYQNENYWHTPQDTMDKLSAKNLAIVGHAVLASVDALEKKLSSGKTDLR